VTLSNRCKATLLGLATALILFLCIEALFFGLLYFQGPSKEIYFDREKQSSAPTASGPLAIPTSYLTLKPRNRNLGGFLVPLDPARTVFDGRFYYEREGLTLVFPGRHRQWKKNPISGETLFEASYLLDEAGYRVTPQKKAGNKHLIFLGDSMTFGDGVNDTETMPAAVAQLQTHFRVYNFSLPTYGLNDLLLRARLENPRQIVKEDSGKILYVYNDFHVFRLLGGRSYLASFGANKPYFVPGENGVPEYKGSFYSAAPLWVWMSFFLSRSQISRYFRLDWPKTIDQDQINFFADAVLDLKRRHIEYFPLSRFVMVISPGMKHNLNMLLPALFHRGIEVLDYSNFALHLYLEGPKRLPLDAHWTAEANAVFGAQLWRDLSRLKEAKRPDPRKAPSTGATPSQAKIRQ
jgi:hypothetical protein